MHCCQNLIQILHHEMEEMRADDAHPSHQLFQYNRLYYHT